MYYDKLFKLMEWTVEKIESNRSRIELMLEKIDAASEADIDHAVEHVTSNFDFSIPGVPTLVGVLVEDFIDSIHARLDHKYVIAVNYPILPSVTLGLNYAQKRTNADIYIFASTLNSINVLGNIFDKYTRVLEVGELVGQAAGRAHCAQYQAEAGLFELGILPVPDQVIVSGWFCDQAAEADEMLSRIFGFEPLYLEGVMDWTWEENLDERIVHYDANSIKRVFNRIEELTGLVANAEDTNKGWQYFGTLANATVNLLDMNAKASRQIFSHADISLVYWSMFVAADLKHEEKVLGAVEKVIKAATERVEKGEGILPENSPKIYLGMRTICDVKNLKIIEEAGLHVTHIFMDAFTKYELMPPIIENPTPEIQATEFFFKRPGLSNAGNLYQYEADSMKQYNCDGAILSYLFNCRPWSLGAVMGKDYIEKTINKPVMIMEADFYDSRLYSPEQQKTRVESFAEVLKLNKEMEIMGLAE
ncbi:2-hydroxyacyl-CoA dehydratase family protein [Acetobacterium wieringae]|uniref:2-hydroxyacyl-CoA dehydratase family protein n=1 Tax=Acetobacterium wieringae TaxID=52694 RepID=UPI002B20B201|nr:2-hydroxyacyl-CoA dehydratase family protein [Acetobacterium wieringae]MEA4807290.1 2-hydroxyacyl-CoA dehydratase family protein [Acetobacterium wieringae]